MRKSVARALVPALAASLLLAGGVAPASATERSQNKSNEQFVPLGLGCPNFTISIETKGGRETERILRKDKAGNVLHRVKTGRDVDVIWRNYGSYIPPAGAKKHPKPRKTVTIDNTRWESNEYPHPDGSETHVHVGDLALVLFPDDVPAGPSASQYRGRVVFDFTPTTGYTVVKDVKAKKRDICAELAR